MKRESYWDKKMRRATMLGLFCNLTLVVACGAAEDARITTIEPPELDFFSKQTICHGIPIKAHKDVDDAAIREASHRLSRLLARVPVVVENLMDVGVEMHIIGQNQQTSDLPYLRHWKGKPYETHATSFQTIDERTRGIGGRLCSCGEENLLRLPTDRYKDHRDICSHEFAHAIFGYGLSPDVREMIRTQYKKSLSQGLWKTAYAATNENEFFAELTMWYVGSRSDYGGIKPTPQLGREWFRNYDPDAFDLLDAIYSGKTKVARTAWKALAPHPATEEGKLRSISSEQPTTLMLDNRTNHDFSLFWLDFDGKRKPYGVLHAGESLEENTYATHPWLLAEPSGNVVGIYVPGKEYGRAVLR